MSIQDFTSALQDTAYKAWFKNSVKSIFIQTTKELRPLEQTTQKTSFLITEKDIADIGAKLAGRAITPQEISTIRTDLLNSVKRNRVITRKNNSLFFPVISFESGISNVLKKGFESLPKVQIVDKDSKQSREARVSDFFQRGHVFSIATNVTEQTIRNLQSSNAPDQVKNTFLPILDAIIADLRQQDLASSNIKSLDVNIYAKYSKNPYKYVVEMQPKKVNEESGRASAPVTNALRRYFDPGSWVEINKFFRKRATEDSFIQKLIQSKGSPSVIDLIAKEIAETIKHGKSITRKQYSVPKTKVSRESIKIETKLFSAAIAENIKKINKLKASLLKAVELAKKSEKLQARPEQQLNLSNLENLLNNNLVRQVKSNMGTGASRTVLNLRTGRFAESVKVERVSESKAGMITAFYSYMKNPYATFSQGGAQSQPTSRDPKLLIAKSIREIASQQVANRLRSVAI
jgi:hypothetical protein